MSDKSSAEKQLQSDAINFSSIARHQLAQFAAAAAKNYKPITQSQPITQTATAATGGGSSSNNSATTSSTTTTTASNSGPQHSATSTPNFAPPVASNSGSQHSAASTPKFAPPVASNSGSQHSAAPTPSLGPPVALNSGSQHSAALNSGASASNSSSSTSKTPTTNATKTTNAAASTHSYSVTGANAHNKSHEVVIATPFKSPMLQEIDSNVTSCKFVLLDPYILEVTGDYEQVTGTFQWEICQDQADRCIEYIKDQCTNKRTFLVCSGGLGQHAVPKMHDLPQLYAVYVYCGNVMFHKEWAKNYAKVRMVCDDDKNHLIPQLALDVAQSNLEWAVDVLKKGGDKEKAKKKLEQALKNVEHHLKGNPQPDLAKEIKRRLEECK